MKKYLRSIDLAVRIVISMLALSWVGVFVISGVFTDFPTKTLVSLFSYFAIPIILLAAAIRGLFLKLDGMIVLVASSFWLLSRAFMHLMNRASNIGELSSYRIGIVLFTWLFF